LPKQLRIQVYGSEVVPPDHTMIQLHSNFTIERSKTSIDGLYPTEHQLHETVEATTSVRDSQCRRNGADRWASTSRTRSDISGFDPFREQEQQIFPALDLNLSPPSGSATPASAWGLHKERTI
jgi:hypothetical protein